MEPAPDYSDDCASCGRVGEQYDVLDRDDHLLGGIVLCEDCLDAIKMGRIEIPVDIDP